MPGLELFIASLAIGVGGTGWTLQGEMFPPPSAGRVASAAVIGQRKPSPATVGTFAGRAGQQ